MPKQRPRQPRVGVGAASRTGDTAVTPPAQELRPQMTNNKPSRKGTHSSEDRGLHSETENAVHLRINTAGQTQTSQQGKEKPEESRTTSQRGGKTACAHERPLAGETCSRWCTSVVASKGSSRFNRFL